MQGKKKKEVKIKIRGGERREEDGGSERRERKSRGRSADVGGKTCLGALEPEAPISDGCQAQNCH
jgi:hypothetical protein